MRQKRVYNSLLLHSIYMALAICGNFLSFFYKALDFYGYALYIEIKNGVYYEFD